MSRYLKVDLALLCLRSALKQEESISCLWGSWSEEPPGLLRTQSLYLKRINDPGFWIYYTLC